MNSYGVIYAPMTLYFVLCSLVLHMGLTVECLG